MMARPAQIDYYLVTTLFINIFYWSTEVRNVGISQQQGNEIHLIKMGMLIFELSSHCSVKLSLAI